MEIIKEYLKYIGEEIGYLDDATVEITTEGNKESQVAEFIQKVKNFYGKDIESSFSQAYLFWKGLFLNQPFGNLVIFNIDEIFTVTEKIHDILQTLSKKSQLKSNYDFLVLGEIGNSLITYDFKKYSYLSEEDFYSRLINSSFKLGETYEGMLEEILTFYVEDLNFEEENEVI